MSKLQCLPRHLPLRWVHRIRIVEGLHRPKFRQDVLCSSLEVVDAGSPAVGRVPSLPADLKGVVQDGWGTGEVGVVATASEVGARVIGAEQGTWNKDTRSKVRVESTWAHNPVHQLWSGLITTDITLSQSPVWYDTVQYGELSRSTATKFELKINTHRIILYCISLHYVNANT